MAIPNLVAMFLPSLDVHVRHLLHECGKVAVRLWPDHGVPMVGWNAKSTNSHPAGSQCLFHDFFEGQEVAIFLEKRPTANASIENVVHQSTRKITRCSWHPYSLAELPSLVKFGRWHLFSSSRKPLADPMIRIPTYWFWFGVFWMVICLTPCLDGHVHYKGFRFGGVILADAYGFWGQSSFGAVLLPIHSALTTFSGVVAAVLQHLHERREGSERHTTRKTYGIGTLLLSTALLAVIFGLLSAMGAPAVVFGCVLMAVAGHFVTAIVVGLLDRTPPPVDDEK